MSTPWTTIATCCAACRNGTLRRWSRCTTSPIRIMAARKRRLGEPRDRPVVRDLRTPKTVEALCDYCQLWITIQEPNNYAMLGYRYGDFPPGKHSRLALSRVLTHLAQAHVRAYHTIKELQPESERGAGYQPTQLCPGSRRPHAGQAHSHGLKPLLRRSISTGAGGWQAANPLTQNPY